MKIEEAWSNNFILPNPFLGELCAEIFLQSVGTRNRVEIELSYRPRQTTQSGGIGSLVSILELLKSLKLGL